MALPRFVPAILLAAALVPAQADDAIRNSFGVTQLDGIVRAGGPTYAASFLRSGMTFTPLLGARVGDAKSVRFDFAAVRRGDTIVVAREGDVEPHVAGNEVRYARTASITEVYDVRHDGVEQRFVFAERPAGTGDLIVSGELATDLPCTGAGDGGARFELPGIGGVTFGGVTGIDANGARVRGSLRVAGTRLELALPASFVDHAAYPLVLDPLIGAAFTIGSTATDANVQPSVAFDASTARYLVVWNAAVSAAQKELRGQLVSGGGTLVGSQLLIATGQWLQRGAVANINSANRFLVAWLSQLDLTGLGNNQIHVRAVNAGNAAMSNSLQVFATGSGTPSPYQAVADFELAGDSRSSAAADEAWLWIRPGTPLYIRIQVGTSGDPTIAGNGNLGSSGLLTPASVAVTSNGGGGGRWLMVWGDSPIFGIFPTQVKCRAFTASGLCGTTTTLFTAAPGDEIGDLAVATKDGVHFLVSWSNTLGGANDIQVCPVVWSGTCAAGSLSPGAMLTLPTPGIQDQLAAEFARDKYLLAFGDRTTAAAVRRVKLLGLHPDTGAAAGAILDVDGASAAGESLPGIATRWGGGDATSDEGLAVWSTTSFDVRGRRCEATSSGSGSVTSLGGACGLTGLTDFATYSGVPVLGTTFSIELAAPTSPILTLIVGFSASPWVCGPCTSVPSPDLLLAPVNPTVVAVPLVPSLIGAELFTQWLQWRPSGCPVLPDFGYSNTLKFTLVE